MTEIPQLVVTDLIQLGAVGEADSTQQRGTAVRLGPFGWVDGLHWKSWDAVTEKMLLSDLTRLARGLVRAEKIEGWGGGSVAGVIWVFQMFQRRVPKAEADALAEWMLANSDNPYLPFRGRQGTARSLAEAERDHQAEAARRLKNAADEGLKQHLRRARKRVRHQLAAERNAVQAGKSLARRQLLDNLRALSLSERIEQIAWDDLHPLSYYPADLAESTIRDTCEVDAVSIHRLVSKAVSLRRGVWHAWVGRLRKICAEQPHLVVAHSLSGLWEMNAPPNRANLAQRKKANPEAKKEK